MKFLDLHLGGFGRFHDLDLHFEDGVNLIYGKNEAGKSTLHSFIRAMLYGLERKPGKAARHDSYSRYEPWEKSGIYEGRMRLEYQGKTYRIERIFQKQNKRLAVIDEGEGRELAEPQGFLNEMLGHMSETAFVNTVCIGQLKTPTDSRMIAELKNYIANLHSSADISLNVNQASEFLKRQRRQWEARLVPEAARAYAACVSEITNLERELAQPCYENQLTHFEQLREENARKLAGLQQERENLLQSSANAVHMLRVSGLESREKILKCMETSEAEYSQYNQLRTQLGTRSHRPLRWLLLALLPLSLLSALVFLQLISPQFFFPEPMQSFMDAVGSISARLAALNPPAILGFTLSLLCALGAYVGLRRLSRSQRVRRSRLAELERSLKEKLLLHTGDEHIDDKQLERLHEKLQDLLDCDQQLLQDLDRLQVLKTELEQLENTGKSYTEALTQQQRAQWELEQKLEQLHQLKEKAAVLKAGTEENDEITRELDAIHMALETLQSLSLSIHSSFGLYLNREASQLIAGITGGVYDSMSVDENLNIFMNTPHKLVPLEQVSSGTMDQIYLALRLASARLMQKGNDFLPLLLDDSFAMYDEDRLRSALSWLSGSYPTQILLFSCHRREERILRELSLPFHKLTL